MGAVDLLGLLPRRYVNVAAEVTYNDDLPDALFRTYARLCGLAWQDTLHHHTHLPQLSLEDLAILCHRQAHAMSLHLRQLRSLGLISYVGNKNGYLIRILDPGRVEQNIAPTGQSFALTEQNFASTEQNFASPMLNDAVVVDQATGARAQQQQQQQAEQNFAPTEQNFASAEQNFALTEQTFASPEQNIAPTEQNIASTEQNIAPTEQNFAPTEQNIAPTRQNFASTGQNSDRVTANLVALGAWGIHPEPPAVQAVAALPHLTPEFVHAWGAELQQRAQVRNLPGLLLYTLRTTTQWPRAETRGGTRGITGATEPPPSEQAPLPVVAAPGLPEEVLADLAELGWSGAVDEVLAHYVTDPDRVLDWLAHWLAQNGGNVRSRAALFRQSLRSGAPAPLAEEDEQAAGVRYISGAYADYIQH